MSPIILRLTPNPITMDATYSQKQEILKKRGITPTTQYHDYDYLYKSIITAMEEYHKVKSKEEAQGRCEKAMNYMYNGRRPSDISRITKAIRLAAGIEGKEEG